MDSESRTDSCGTGIDSFGFRNRPNTSVKQHREKVEYGKPTIILERGDSFELWKKFISFFQEKTSSDIQLPGERNVISITSSLHSLSVVKICS